MVILASIVSESLKFCKILTKNHDKFDEFFHNVVSIPECLQKVREGRRVQVPDRDPRPAAQGRGSPQPSSLAALPARTKGNCMKMFSNECSNLLQQLVLRASKIC